MTYPISEIKTVLHIIYLVLFHHNYSAAPSQKSQLRTPSSPNHIRKRISQRAPDDYEKFLFVLWRWNSRKRGALWRTRFLLLRRFIGMLSTRKPGIIVRSPLNITLPNRSHKKRRHHLMSSFVTENISQVIQTTLCKKNRERAMTHSLQKS